MKKTITNSEELAEAIAALELKAAAQRRDIEETFHAVAEDLQPLNLVKNGLRSVFSGEHKGELVQCPDRAGFRTAEPKTDPWQNHWLCRKNSG